jgi:hypothetical protein
MKTSIAGMLDALEVLDPASSDLVLWVKLYVADAPSALTFSDMTVEKTHIVGREPSTLTPAAARWHFIPKEMVVGFTAEIDVSACAAAKIEPTLPAVIAHLSRRA